MGPLYRPKRVQDPIPPLSVVLINLCQSSSPLLREIENFSRNGQWKGYGCISSCSDTSKIQKIPLVHLRTSGLSVHCLTFGNVPKSVDFHKINDCNSSTRAVSLFPYLDDWLIRDLIRNRLISHTKYTLQTVQNLGFIPNLRSQI